MGSNQAATEIATVARNKSDLYSICKFYSNVKDEATNKCLSLFLQADTSFFLYRNKFCQIQEQKVVYHCLDLRELGDMS
ncbi:hypothetical protein A0J61_07828 [Choanephora cucurbitarum]|uniref:Uncharacterized protein n=1 Tax=Choanephora cucurbitarum TaxID=101091 RepID=A0A1C7N4S8_9FUNG|nr:hypothetical protein A0J61_07828 [Choanephora cucurbitarum]